MRPLSVSALNGVLAQRLLRVVCPHCTAAYQPDARLLADSGVSAQAAAGFKFMHSVFTALVALPTLLTVFTICASVEIAGRLRGGRGALGWIAALPWRNEG